MKSISDFLVENVKCMITYINENRDYECAKKAVRTYANPKDEGEVVSIIHDMYKIVPNTRLLNAKYLTGSIRLVYNEELDESQQETVNDIIQVIINDKKLTDKYDRDFNGLYYEELLFELSEEIDDLIKNERKATKAHSDKVNENYEIVYIPNYDKAKEYKSYVDWCITKSDFSFKTYTPHNEVFYFAIRKDFKEINKPETQPNNPKDEYGLSMLAISVRKNGRLASCTTRWNDASLGNKSLNVNEICELLGCNFYEVFKPQ